MEKINLVELLKDCPKGMKLDCSIFENLEFDRIDKNNETYPIICRVKTSFGSYNYHTFTAYGCYSTANYSKCTIFPKGKITWEEFQRPFKDGDIVVCDYDTPHRDNLQIFIFKNKKENSTLSSCYLMLDGDELDLEEGMYYITRLASEEEKQKLFQAIKDNGYHWNAETKTLEKSNPFYTGEVLVSSMGNIVLVSHVDDKEIIYYHCILEPLGDFRIHETPNCGVGKTYNCTLANNVQRDKLFDRLKKSGYKYNPRSNKLEKLPRFKVGDKIQWKEDIREKRIIDNVLNNCYTVQGYGVILFYQQDEWELVPNKFDINTLKTFDRVLVRCSDNGYWQPQFFHKFRSNSEFPFECTYNSWRQCIPYEGNEHLSDTTNDCDEFYKIW